MSVADEYLRNNEEYARTYAGPLPVRPSRHAAIVACMDSRMKIFGLLGMGDGESHVIRNAGGVVTDDVIRSLAVSQRLLGTRGIVLVHHTDCGMQKLTDDEFRDELEADTGIRPPFALEAFPDLEGD